MFFNAGNPGDMAILAILLPRLAILKESTKTEEEKSS
jgi:hypothetical protein